MCKEWERKEWGRKGVCGEQELQELFAKDGYSYFVAYQTDKFISGRNTSAALSQIDSKKLLEIRLFSEKKEVLARRTMIGAEHKFQWREASEEGLSNDEYVVSYQTLDIDRTKTSSGLNGNLQLMTTGGGKYELPIDKNHDSIKVISYIDYDKSGMAYIYDDRLAGFVTQGGRD